VEQSGEDTLRFEFTGTYNHSLDLKGRLTLPASFRVHLNDEQAPKFAPSFDKKCIVIYPLPVWLSLLDRIKALSKSDPSAVSVRRVILSMAFDCEVDRQGRVLVPLPLRSLTGIGRDVTVVGSLESAEIWDRGKWEEYFRQGHEQLEPNASRFTL